MNVDVVRDDSSLVRETIETRHYLHRYPDARSLPFGYRLIVNGSDFAADGLPHGIVIMKKPQHLKQRFLFGYPGLPTQWQVLDLARVWVHPQWQRRDESGHALCMFSRMVSRVMKRVQRDWLVHHPPRYPHLPYHIELIISYCDLLHHEGTGYRASNFKSFGVTSDRTKEVYFYQMQAPRWKWCLDDADVPAQMPMFEDVPIKW